MKTVPSLLTEMISEVPIIWLLSLCSMGSIVAIVFGCVCGCRKKVPKNELMGLAGMVKLTNPEGNISYNTTIPVVQVDSDNATSEYGAHFQDQPDLNKRPSSATATATRSLPDLPVEPGVSAWDHNDTSSDLYATVEENKSDKRRCLMQSQSGDDGYNSPTQTDDSLSPYARVKGEHPYDQLKQSEHPYAQVHANGIPAGSIPKHNNSAMASASSQNADNKRADNSPIAPPRMRKSLALSDSSLASVPDSIAAATAIAGGIPANQELPYMTPPLIALNPAEMAAAAAATNHTQHFSGDSQDSSKGYTSISVREPLSTILGERSRSQRQDLIDSHYMTVSDDSDEMYAAIEEPGQAVYTSGSETYARIRPNPLPQTRPPPGPATSAAEETVERPPSQQARRTSHSRQASSSSAASSGVSPNSPKPEKRQANSPLPRPPPDFLSSGAAAAAALASPVAVDDMYAKVMKKRRSSQSVTSLEENHMSATPSDSANAAPPGYERLSPSAEPNYEELKPQDLKPARSLIESNYAKVNKTRTKNNSDKPLSGLAPVEPAYASLSRKDSGHDPDYESVSANSQNDPNYESLEKTDSENDPPYEKLQSTSSASLDDDYETVFRVDSTQVYSRMEERDS